MIPAANLQNLGSETAFAVLARATELAAQGHDIINLGIGQPDFKIPDTSWKPRSKPCVTPGGAFYAFPNVKETGYATRDLGQALLEEAGGAVIHGTSFGTMGEGFLRFSYAASMENIREATARIEAFLGRA